MIFIVSLFFGAMLSAAGMFAKQINSGYGSEFFDQRVQAYFTRLGILSNLIIPLLAVVLATILLGVQMGLIAGGLLMTGAFCVGLLRPSRKFKFVSALVGVPLLGLLFIIVLFVQSS